MGNVKENLFLDVFGIFQFIQRWTLFMTEYFIIRMLGPTVYLKLKWRDRQPLISMKTCSRISFGD